MEAIVASLITIVSVMLLGIAGTIGFRFGYKMGIKSGRKEAVTDLIVAKDPEAWDKAHFLEVETISREETSKIKKPTK